MTYNPTQSTDHARRGLAKFLEQFKDKAKLNAFARSYLDRIQEAEDALWEILTIRGIDASSGIGLDMIGNLVKRKRLGLEDDDYKIALKAQIRINRSSGTPEDLITVTGLSVPAGQDFSYDESYPAGVVIEILEEAAFNVNMLLDNLIRTKAGGIRLLLYYWPFAGPAFTFSEDDTDTADPDHGFGDDEDESIGGYLIDVLTRVVI